MADTHRIDPDQRPYEVSRLPTKPVAGIEPFAALDLRVGTVVEVVAFPEAREPAWKLAVDFGPVLGVLWTSAKVTNYPSEELVGRQVVGAVNLGSRRIAGFVSQFLVLGGLEGDGTVRLLRPDHPLPDGSTVG